MDVHQTGVVSDSCTRTKHMAVSRIVHDHQQEFLLTEVVTSLRPFLSIHLM